MSEKNGVKHHNSEQRQLQCGCNHQPLTLSSGFIHFQRTFCNNNNNSNGPRAEHVSHWLPPHQECPLSQQTRKKQAFRKDFLQESPSEQAQQLKLRQLKPLGEIEAIMRHFDAKFSNAKPRKKPLFKDSARRRVDSEDHQDLQQRMSYLLQLPAIANIRREAQRYRNQINVEEIRQREQRKAQIMQNFKLYMAAEQKGNSEMARKRLYTIN